MHCKSLFSEITNEGSNMSREMGKQLSELQKKLSDLEINTRVNFAKQEIEISMLKNQISQGKEKDQDKQLSSSRSRQPLREIFHPGPRVLLQSTNTNSRQVSREISPLPGLTSPRPWGSEVVELETSPTLTPLLNQGSTLIPALSPSSPTIAPIFPVMQGACRIATPSLTRPVNKSSNTISSSPRAFPRLAVSSKSRAARPRPPPTSPRHSVKCPMCQKTVKKPMRLHQCPQVCIITFLANILHYNVDFLGNFAL